MTTMNLYRYASAGTSLVTNGLIVRCSNVRFLSYRPVSIRRGRRSAAQKSAQGTRANKAASSSSSVNRLQNFIDDELYHDRDFEYLDQRKLHLTKQLSAKYLGNDPNNSPNAVLQGKYRNALYENDEDDLKLARVKRNSVPHKSDHFIHELHQKFKNEKNQPQTQSNESNKSNTDIDWHNEQSPKESGEVKKSKKKRPRMIVPLPYNITAENRHKVLNKIVIPYFEMSYEAQLRKKYQHNLQVLRKLGSKLNEFDGPVRVGRTGLPCPLEPVRPSPRIEQYRNKDEFSVWPGIDNNPKTVGFFVGQPSLHDRVVCVEPDEVIITKKSHIKLAKKFQNYLREVSPYDVCQNYGEGGHWRRVHIRSNEANEHMLTAIMHPQELTIEQMEKEMDQLKQYFSDEPFLRSLYFHASRHTRSTHTSEPYYHLAGEPTISERLFDRQFVISPSSFFQVNTAAAEVLYRVVMTELNACNRDTTLLDLCCGTGTLACLMADHVKQVIAIDSSASAIENAKQNAEVNGVTNIQFICAPVEQALPQLIEQQYFGDHIIAVANPSRRAFHPGLIRVLRRKNYIKKLIYISCKAHGDAFNNFVQLCKPHPNSGSPFMPVNAIPVDLFPHTEHCELVLTFERF